jgi:scyllo-inositol 2-dehydrogenase (NADP+)
MAHGVCIIGCGLSGLTFHAPLVLALRKRFDLACFVTSKSEDEVFSLIGTKVRCYKTFAEACDFSDTFSVVIVTSPNDTHKLFAVEALQRGKHVVVEKPFALTLGEADEMIKTANSTAGTLLSCFQNRRFDSDFLTVQQLLTSGVLGEVMSFRSEWRRFRPQIKDNWRWKKGPGAGLVRTFRGVFAFLNGWFQLYDLGPHMIHQALELFGFPSSVSCTRASQRGSEVDDFFSLTLMYGPRLVVQLEAGYMFHSSEFGERVWLVYGDKGSFEKRRGIDVQEAQLKSGKEPGSQGWGLEEEKDWGILSLVGKVICFVVCLFFLKKKKKKGTCSR